MIHVGEPPVFHESPSHVPKSGLVGARDGVEAPRALAGVGAVGVEKPSDAVLAAGDAGDDEDP